MCFFPESAHEDERINKLFKKKVSTSSSIPTILKNPPLVPITKDIIKSFHSPDLRAVPLQK